MHVWNSQKVLKNISYPQNQKKDIRNKICMIFSFKIKHIALI